MSLGEQRPPPLMLRGDAEEYASTVPLDRDLARLAIALTQFGFSLFSDALRDALHPKLRDRWLPTCAAAGARNRKTALAPHKPETATKTIAMLDGSGTASSCPALMTRLSMKISLRFVMSCTRRSTVLAV